MTLYRVASRALVLGGTGLGGAAVYRYYGCVARERELPTKTLFKFEERASSKQPVVVVGGGVVGVTAAYKLAGEAGCRVVVLEPRRGPGEECSHCAAGGMQISNPTVDRDSWIAVTKCIAPVSRYVLGGKAAETFKFFNISWWETLSDPFFLRWVLTFTKTSLWPCVDQEQKQKEMLSFTNFAVEDMKKMMDDPKDNMAAASGYNSTGSLSLSYDPAVKENTVTAARRKSKTPTHSKNSLEPSEQVTGDEILAMEPSVRFQEKLPSSGKFEPEASAASSGRFTQELATRCANDPTLDVTFLYDTAVKAVTVDGKGNGKPKISALHTNRGVVAVPDNCKVVVAAGSWTPHILALMDLYCPVYPLKGYAMSVSAQEAIQAGLQPKDLPSRIVCDKYMYTSRLGDEIRITSIGEFSGWSTRPTPAVDAEFRREAARQFPQLQPFIDTAVTYCGHRPFVSDGILLLGAVDTHENLLVSTGPGSNGWKLAMGSGEIIQRLVSGQTEQQISQDLGFDCATLSPAGRVLNAPLFAKLCRARWDV